ncbi:MAG: hypothetical protein HY301_00715, partial [Verrucomicrobia bacterium]|nr:hypothetical protein [Verrucomicrobiota bacterium]
HTAITWNATALHDFPIVIETTEKGSAITLLFTDVKLGKPAASAFEPPKEFKKYDSMQQMMREAMMKRFNPDALDK